MKKSSKIALGVLGAAAIGVMIGGLFYTEKGKTLRKSAKSKFTDLSNQLSELATKVKKDVKPGTD